MQRIFDSIVNKKKGTLGANNIFHGKMSTDDVEEIESLQLSNVVIIGESLKLHVNPYNGVL